MPSQYMLRVLFVPLQFKGGKMNYIKIPRALIYDSTIQNKDLILVYSYLYIRNGLDNVVLFTIDNMVSWAGYTPDSHKGKVNDRFISYLEYLSNNEYIVASINYRNYSGNECIQVTVNANHFHLIPDNFAIIHIDEIHKLMNYKEYLTDYSRISTGKLLSLLSYIRANTNVNPKKPLCCYRMYKTISTDIGLSIKAIPKLVFALDELDIIKTHSLKKVKIRKENGSYIFLTAPKIFVDCYKYLYDDIFDTTYDYKKEIEKQIRFFENQKEK